MTLHITTEKGNNVNKTIELTEWEKRVVAHIRRNRNKANLLTCSVSHVSASGMTRHIKVGMAYKGEFINISYLVAKVADYRHTKKGDYALIVNGCGMDMCFSVVYNFCAALGIDGGARAAQHYSYF